MQTTYLPKLSSWIDPVFWLYFPKNCPACGRPLRLFGANICGRCSQNLPETHFFEAPNNPIEKIFYGRLPISAGAAAWYFHKNSALQALLFQLKYKSNKDVGLFIGKQMGALLAASERFSSIDALVPVPLHPQALSKRGFNQAALICEGIGQVWHKPVLTGAIARTKHTSTQTKQTRAERWDNMEDAFTIKDPTSINGKHLLIIDDVITTGATIEACGKTLLTIKDVRVSVAAAAYPLK
ncbi:MAG: ComF family protein [Sediminibacterium sp.]|jgi:ComF family protein|nr:ComF family protein [Sediminibacterium sp.]